MKTSTALMEVVLPHWLTETTCLAPPVPADAFKPRWVPTHIYALLDPETGAPRYIGQTIRPKERLQNHMNEISNCHRSHWLQSLKRRGLKPEMVTLATVEGGWPWQLEERWWIALGRRLGWPLTNNTSGGDGVPDLPPETRARMASVWRGRKHKPESIQKLKAARALRVCTDETRAKMSAAQSGRKILWADKIAAAVRKLSAEQVAEVRRRLAAGEKGKDLAVEYGVHRTTISKIKMGAYCPASLFAGGTP
jgi:hypothetical protein